MWIDFDLRASFLVRIWLAVAAVLLGALGCSGLRATQLKVSQALVGQPLTVLRGCAGSPEIEEAGEVEVQRYTWVLSSFEDPFPSDRRFGAPSGFPSSREREEATCTLEVEAQGGRIQRTEITGKLVFPDDFTRRCAAVLLRCLR